MIQEEILKRVQHYLAKECFSNLEVSVNSSDLSDGWMLVIFLYNSELDRQFTLTCILEPENPDRAKRFYLVAKRFNWDMYKQYSILSLSFEKLDEYISAAFSTIVGDMFLR